MIKFLIFLLSFFYSLSAWGQLKETDRQELLYNNILGNYNPGFENGLAKWTKSGSSTLTKETANPGVGTTSAIWDATANGEYLRGTLVTIPNILKNKICYAKMHYKDGDANLAFQVVDGSTNILATITLSASSSWTERTLQFPCPESSTLAPRLLASADAAAVTVDGFYWGLEKIVQGIPTTEWTSYTPSNYLGFGSITSIKLEWKRIGPSLFVRGFFTTGTVSGDEAQLELPNSFVIGGNATGDTVNVGTFYEDRNTAQVKNLIATAGDTYLNFSLGDAANSALDPKLGNACAVSTTRISVFAGPIPITAWAGSTVGLSNSAVEYYATSGTWDADSSTTAYGPNGATMTGALAAARTKTITTATRILPTDKLSLEIDVGSGYGFNEIWSEILQGASSGVTIRATGSSTIQVIFRRYYSGTSDWTNGWRWRVVKSSNPLSIGSLTSIKYQQKFLASDITTQGIYADTVAGNGAFKFTLEAGKTYRITFHMHCILTTGGDVIITLHDNITPFAYVRHHDANAATIAETSDVTILRTMTSTSLRLYIDDNGEAITGNGTYTGTWIIVEELPYHITTTGW